MTLIFVDVEAVGPSVSTGRMTEFGAVEFNTRRSFHGILDREIALRRRPDLATYMVEGRESHYHASVTTSEDDGDRITMIGDVRPRELFWSFDAWLGQFDPPHIFVSDNPAYDWQWINDAFHLHVGRNPFGHSARRIGDFYAGLERDWRAASKWKRFRRTPHDHDPVHDAMGNVEAFTEFVLRQGVFEEINQVTLLREVTFAVDGVDDLYEGLVRALRQMQGRDT